MRKRTNSELGTAIVGLTAIVILIYVVYASTVERFDVTSGPGTSEEIAIRLAPIGDIQLAGAEGSAPAAAAMVPAADTEADEGPGAAVYARACVICHDSGAAGAPKISDPAAWAPRIEQGMEQLLHTAINGKGAMPPRGTCVDCTDEDLKAAIQYMLDEVEAAS